MLSRFLTVIAAVLYVAACSGPDIDNRPPVTVSITDEVPSSVTASPLQKRFNEVQRLRKQREELLSDIHQERAERDYSEPLLALIKELVEVNRVLGAQAACLAAATKDDSFARAVFENAALGEKVGLISAAYTIGGLELNMDYLTSPERDAYFNKLLAEHQQRTREENRLVRTVLNELKTSQTANEVSDCDTANRKNAIPVRFEGLGNDAPLLKKELRAKIQEVGTKTALARVPDASLLLSFEKLQDPEGTGRTVEKVAYFLFLWHLDMRGVAPSFRVYLEQGGGATPLEVNTFEISAKERETLLYLIAERIAGEAHFALLRNELEKAKG